MLTEDNTQYHDYEIDGKNLFMCLSISEKAPRQEILEFKREFERLILDFCGTLPRRQVGNLSRKKANFVRFKKEKQKEREKEKKKIKIKKF